MSELNVGNISQQRWGKLYFVQWLRVFLISLVVAHHAAQPYGPTGGEWPVDDPVSSNLLGLFFLFNSTFFMGFFFFLSGYFVSGSYDRKGGAAFVRDRIIRLGIPLVLVSLFLFGPITYMGSGSQDGFVVFLLWQYIGQWQVEMGPLWFIAQLLALSIIYALWRVLMSAQKASAPRIFSFPSNRTIFIYALTLGIVGMIVRNFYHQDYWVKILGVIPAEVVHMPQYWSLFIIGIIAGRGKWFEKMPSSLGPKWMATGLVAFVIAILTVPFIQVFPRGMLPDALTLGGQTMGHSLRPAGSLYVCRPYRWVISVLPRSFLNPKQVDGTPGSECFWRLHNPCFHPRWIADGYSQFRSVRFNQIRDCDHSRIDHQLPHLGLDTPHSRCKTSYLGSWLPVDCDSYGVGWRPS